MMKFLRSVHRILLRLARFIGRINTFLLLAVSFYLVLFPLSLFFRIFGKRKAHSGWLERPALPRDHFRKQY